MDATKETAKAVVERVQRERQKQSFGFAWDKQEVFKNYDISTLDESNKLLMPLISKHNSIFVNVIF